MNLLFVVFVVIASILKTVFYKITKALAEVDVGQRLLGGVVALEDLRKFVVGVLRRQWSIRCVQLRCIAPHCRSLCKSNVLASHSVLLPSILRARGKPLFGLNKLFKTLSFAYLIYPKR